MHDRHKWNTLITKLKIKADLLKNESNDATHNCEIIERMREILLELEQSSVEGKN